MDREKISLQRGDLTRHTEEKQASQGNTSAAGAADKRPPKNNADLGKKNGVRNNEDSDGVVRRLAQRDVNSLKREPGRLCQHYAPEKQACGS
jgi:hypothetical protein